MATCQEVRNPSEASRTWVGIVLRAEEKTQSCANINKVTRTKSSASTPVPFGVATNTMQALAYSALVRCSWGLEAAPMGDWV